MLNLKVPTVTGMKPEQVNGLLLSYLTAVAEVTEGHRKASFLSHFYKERLNRFERKKLILVLNHLISQLAEQGSKKVHLLSSVDPQESKLPDEFAEFLLYFQRSSV